MDGKAFCAYQTRKGLTNSEMAEKLGVSLKTISNYRLKGHPKPGYMLSYMERYHLPDVDPSVLEAKREVRWRRQAEEKLTGDVQRSLERLGRARVVEIVNEVVNKGAEAAEATPGGDMGRETWDYDPTGYRDPSLDDLGDRSEPEGWE